MTCAIPSVLSGAASSSEIQRDDDITVSGYFKGSAEVRDTGFNRIRIIDRDDLKKLEGSDSGWNWKIDKK